MNNKRSQAAMEFLMTYGWVLLVVIASIGVLLGLGVMNPSNFEKDSCSFPIDLVCSDYIVQSHLNQGSIKITILNSLGNDIRINSIIATNNLFKTNCSWNLTNGVLLENSKNFTFVLNKTNGRNGDLCNIDSSFVNQKTETDWNLRMKWYSANTKSEYSHEIFGHITANVES